jgi:hypothetical protein
MAALTHPAVGVDPTNIVTRQAALPLNGLRSDEKPSVSLGRFHRLGVAGATKFVVLLWMTLRAHPRRDVSVDGEHGLVIVAVTSHAVEALAEVDAGHPLAHEVAIGLGVAAHTGVRVEIVDQDGDEPVPHDDEEQQHRPQRQPQR